jgi:hypothetical protein
MDFSIQRLNAEEGKSLSPASARLDELGLGRLGMTVAYAQAVGLLSKLTV